MGFSRFDGVERIQGSSMPFENYLRQINLLYPNLPDLYVKYLQMIYEFEAEQLERLLSLNIQELSNEIVSSIFNALYKVKNKNSGLFNSFIENFNYQDIAIDLFNIEIPESLSFEEWLEEINAMYVSDDFYYYLQLIYLFNRNQLQRLLEDGDINSSDDIVTNIFNALLQVKQSNIDIFNSFVETFLYKERAIELFDIEVSTEPELIGYCETKTTEFKPNKLIYFTQLYNDVISIAVSEPYIKAELITEDELFLGFKLTSEKQFEETVTVTIIAMCAIESDEVTANV